MNSYLDIALDGEVVRYYEGHEAEIVLLRHEMEGQADICHLEMSNNSKVKYYHELTSKFVRL